jgi:putative redox protein
MGASTQEFAVPPGPSGPVITRSAIQWRGDRSFNAGPAGRQHVIDGAAKEAPGPVETLLSSLAACSSLDVIDIMAKRKTPLEKLAVNVTAERRPEFPRRIMRLDVEFVVEGAGVEREHTERAIQLSFERYCSVASSLAPDIVMEARLTLNGETGSAMRQKIWRPTI